MSSDQKWDQPTEYEEWYQSSLGKAYGASLRHHLGSWIPVDPDGWVLDIGCGPGLLLEKLLPEARKVIAIDCSEEMSHRAKYRFKTSGLPYQVMTASADTLPFPDHFSELVMTVNCFEFVDYPGHAFREIERVLTAGGTAIVGVLNRNSIWETTRWMGQLVSDAPYYEGNFFTRQELVEQVRNVGLTVEDVKTAVHFPPVSTGPVQQVLNGLDRRWRLFTGALLLCRARKD